MIIGLIRPTYYTPTTVGLFTIRHIIILAFKGFCLSELRCSVFENTCFGVNCSHKSLLLFRPLIATLFLGDFA